jgi:hypothetical protein
MTTTETAISKPPSIRFSHLHLVANRQKALNEIFSFYRNVLGLQPVSHASANNCAPSPGQSVWLHAFPSSEPSLTDITHDLHAVEWTVQVEFLPVDGSVEKGTFIDLQYPLLTILYYVSFSYYVSLLSFILALYCLIYCLPGYLFHLSFLISLSLYTVSCLSFDCCLMLPSSHISFPLLFHASFLSYLFSSLFSYLFSSLFSYLFLFIVSSLSFHCCFMPPSSHISFSLLFHLSPFIAVSCLLPLISLSLYCFISLLFMPLFSHILFRGIVVSL